MRIFRTKTRKINHTTYLMERAEEALVDPNSQPDPTFRVVQSAEFFFQEAEPVKEEVFKVTITNPELTEPNMEENILITEDPVVASSRLNFMLHTRRKVHDYISLTVVATKSTSFTVVVPKDTTVDQLTKHIDAIFSLKYTLSHNN